jgi:folate-binding protein YgfZ
MTFVQLRQFGLIRFTGSDARAFLQGQLSCDVNGLQSGRATYGTYNSPQGRVLATFLLWQDGSGYYMQLPKLLAAPMHKRLSMYILRSKVQALNASDDRVLFGLSVGELGAELEAQLGPVPAADLSLEESADHQLLRLSADRFLVSVAAAAVDAFLKERLQTGVEASMDVWNWYDLRDGVPWVLPPTQDQFVAQMLNMDLIGGVSFTKGCYPGQEIVARMHYLGRLKQRMYLAHVEAVAPAPAPGDRLFSPDLGDQACGTVLNSAPAPQHGFDLLAVVQIASVNSRQVQFRSQAGPHLEFRQLPYTATG